MKNSGSNDSGPTAVYRFYDVGDSLLYVGCTATPDNRFRAHAADKEWWPQVARKKIEWHPDLRSGRDAEAVAIRRENPRYNRAIPGVTPPDIQSRLAEYKPEETQASRDLHNAIMADLARIDQVGLADPLEAAKLAGEYIEKLNRQRGEIAVLRAEMVQRIMREHNLSMGGAAQTLGVSRQRIKQILSKAPAASD